MKTLLPWMAIVAVALDSGCQMPLFATKAKTDAKTYEPLIAADNSLESGTQGSAGSADRRPAAETRSPQPPSRSPSSPSSTTATVAQHLHEGHAALREGDTSEAQRHYEAVLKLRPRHPDAHHRLAIIADNQKDYRTAERHYLTALKSKPRDANLLSDLGYSYRLQGRLDESERYLQQALEIQPNHKHALSNLGVLYASQGDYDGALAMFLRAGDEADAYANMAKLFPQGRPAGSGSDPAESSFADEFNAMAAADAAEPRSSQTEMNEPTRQLKQMMEQARREAIAARNTENDTPDWARDEWDRQTQPQVPGDARRDLASAPRPSSANPSRWPSEPSSRATDPRTWPPQNGFGPTSPRDVPDSRLNDTLADIDRGRDSGDGRSRSAAEFSNGRPDDSMATALGARGPQITPRFPGDNENSESDRMPSITPAASSPQLADTNPLDSMETWPPASGGSDSEDNVELASGTIEPWPHARHDAQSDRASERELPSHGGEDSPAAWPQAPTEGDSTSPTKQSGIRPINYSSAESESSTSSPNEAVRRAALLGMSAGPGEMFPMTQSGTSEFSSAPSIPPGAGTRINGAQYAAPPQHRDVPPQRQFSSDQAAAHRFQRGRQSEFQQSQFERESAAPHQAVRGNERRAATDDDRYTMFTSDGTAPVSYQDKDNAHNAPRHDPLSDYEAQMRRHNEEFGNVSRRLHAERQHPSQTPPAWPSQPSSSAANASSQPSGAARPAFQDQAWPEDRQRPMDRRWDDHASPSGIVPSQHEVPADRSSPSAFRESFDSMPRGGGRSPAGFDSSPNDYQGAIITPR